ncbi:MAG: hypothetical protein DRP74_07585, partial [Candidatus Omnitrophota bacterium]
MISSTVMFDYIYKQAEFDLARIVLAMLEVNCGARGIIMTVLGNNRSRVIELAKGLDNLKREEIDLDIYRNSVHVFNSMADSDRNIGITTAHLLYAVLEVKGRVRDLLVSYGITLNTVRKFLEKKDRDEEPSFDVAEKICVNLCTAEILGVRNNIITGRNAEIDEMIRILLRRSKNNPVLVGEPGVGKTAIVEGLAQRIVNGDVPGDLKNWRIYSLRLPDINPANRASFEQTIRSLLDELYDTDGILFIDEFHSIAAPQTAGGSGMGDLLKPDLANGHIRFIGATTLDEYRQYIEADSALERRLTPIFVKELSATDT